MHKLTLLALVLVAAAFAGCSTTSSQCGCLPANCCSWDFYQPCDLIEGRAADCGGPPAGTVVECAPAVPVEEAPAETPAEAPVEEAPPVAPSQDPVSDYGLPPAGR